MGQDGTSIGDTFTRIVGATGTLLLGLAVSLTPMAAHAGRPAAFVAPDIPQTRRLFEDFKRVAARELEQSGTELRFVPMSPGDPEGNARRVRAAIADAPAFIVAASTEDALIAKEATPTIPIIFSSVTDPVRAGLVKSLAQPGGNLTGFTYDAPVEGKQLELLKEIAPQVRVVGVIEDGHWRDARVTREQIARYEDALRVRIKVFRASSASGLASIVLGREAAEVDAWLVPISNTAALGRAQLIDALRKARRPAVFGRTLFVESGGLASFQEVVREPLEIWRGMLESILKGVPPARIPVQRPKDHELALNLAEAQRIGVVMPVALLRRADRVLSK